MTAIATDSARSSALKTYRILLGRFESPKDGDVDLLFETIGTLDLSFEQVERDAAIRSEALVNQRIATELPRLLRAVNSLEVKVENHEARAVNYVHAIDAHARARRAALEFARAKREHRELLDDLELK